NGQGPDLLGLAEISTRSLLDELAAKLPGKYLKVWEPPAKATQTGLALLGRDNVFAQLQPVAVQRPPGLARPRCLVVHCELIGKLEPVLVAVNHWKSRMPAEASGQLHDADDRRESARWLGDLLANSQPGTAAVVLGDFNAEPWEPPFNEVGLRSVRFFSTALYASATPAYLYNTAWRFMTEPDFWEEARLPHYQEPRPKTSHGKGAWLIYDQLLVSAGALRTGPIELVEKSVQYHCQNNLTSRRTNRGALRPLPWQTAAGGGYVGTSDHFPLLAVFKL
ncbi:MAG: endonuclease/exonuclease/phosphatase family protein, partial [Pirellulales bacterium]